MSRVAINIDRYGNTLAASIPIALDEALTAGRAQPGDLAALVGFGAGLAWGGVLLQL
jgi:3-oxoacyl-[acyl-carrier-protein] synthase-3